MIIKYGNHGFTFFHFLLMPYLTAYPTELPKFTPVFSVGRSFVFCVVFCIVDLLLLMILFRFIRFYHVSLVLLFVFSNSVNLFSLDQTWNGWNRFSMTYFSFFLSLWCLFIELLSLSLLLQKKKNWCINGLNVLSGLRRVWRFEDTKGVIRICKSKKDRQYKGQKKKDKGTDNDLQNIHIKLKID